MHCGTNNPKHVYSLRCPLKQKTYIINTTHSEKDLGVLISEDLEWSEHTRQAVSKTNRILGLLNNTFLYMDIPLMKTLYCSYVRPHLEYASSVSNPHCKKDIEFIEKVQRRATKMVHWLKDFTYETRLEIFNLQTVEKLRIRTDLIQQYKISNDID